MAFTDQFETPGFSVGQAVPYVTPSGVVPLKPTSTAVAANPNIFTPFTTFSYIVGSGGSRTFYAGIPVTLDAGLRAILIAAGKGS